MPDTSVYYVRSLALQKEIIDPDDGSRSLQAYKPNAKVELTPDEAIRYQALVETEEAYKTRQPKKGNTKQAKDTPAK